MNRATSKRGPKRSRARLAWLVAAAILVPAIVGGVIIPGCYADHAKLGRERFEARDYHAAVEELTWALERNPNDSASRFLLARAQSFSSRRFDAKVNLQEVRKDPALRKQASRVLVGLLTDEKNFDAAEAVVTEELDATPDDPDWIETRGLLSLKTADFALTELQKTLEEPWGQWPAYWAVRRVYESRSRPTHAWEGWLTATLEALDKQYGITQTSAYVESARKARTKILRVESDLQDAAAKNPLAFRAMTELGQIAIDRGDTDAARASFMRVIALDETKLPDSDSKKAYSQHHVRAVELLSSHLELVGLMDESIALLDSELQNGMLTPSMEERLGRQYVNRGMWKEASALAEILLEADPKNTWANYMKGVVAAHEGRDEDAVTYLNRAQVQSPENAVINAALARALAKVKRDTLAAEHYRLAIAGALGNDVDLNIEYAQVLTRESDAALGAQFLESRLAAPFNNPASKEHQRIIEEIRRLSTLAGIGASTLVEARNALTANPQNVFARLSVAKHEHQNGLSTLALPRVQEVTLEYPGLADGWLLLSQILGDIGRGNEAGPALLKAASLRPDDPNIPWLQGRIALKNGEIDAARNAFSKALEIDADLPGAKLDLLDLELLANDYDAAQKHAEALLVRYPGDPRVLRGVGLARLAMKDAAGAVEPLRKAAAANPGDSTIRIGLAKALLETGPVDEAQRSLREIAHDVKIPKAIRREAADALDAGGFWSQAADAYTQLFEAASDEAERAELAARAFSAYTSGGNYSAALDELVRMRQTGRQVQAQRLFLIAAEKAGFHREAGEQADLLRAEDGHDVASLAAARSAHAKLKQWNKAIEDADDLIRLSQKTPELLVHRGEALLRVGKVSEAEEAATQAGARRTGDALPALRLKLAVAAAKGDGPGIEHALREVLAAQPGDVEARMTAARALASIGQIENAAGILTVSPFRVADEASALAAAAILVADQNPTGALTILDLAADRGPRVGAMRALVALLAGKDAIPDSPLPRFLGHLASQNWSAAAAEVPALDEPESVKEQWLAIVALGASPGASQAATLDLVRARIFKDSGIFTDRMDSILRSFSERAGAAGTPFDLLRAWWRLELGDAKPAADIVVPMMETKSRTALVLLTAALAGAELAGEGAPMKVLDSGSDAPPEAFVRDLAHALAAKGQHASAIRVYARLKNPDERDRALRLLLGVERRELRDAQAVLPTLPERYTRSPALLAARLWVEIQTDKTKGAAVTEIKALTAKPRDLEQVDKPVFGEAVLMAGLSAEAASFLATELLAAKFSAETLNRYAEVLRRFKIDKAKLQVVEDRLRIVDPKGSARVLKPRPVTVPR